MQTGSGQSDRDPARAAPAAAQGQLERVVSDLARREAEAFHSLSAETGSMVDSNRAIAQSVDSALQSADSVRAAVEAGPRLT